MFFKLCSTYFFLHRKIIYFFFWNEEQSNYSALVAIENLLKIWIANANCYRCCTLCIWYNYTLLYLQIFALIAQTSNSLIDYWFYAIIIFESSSFCTYKRNSKFLFYVCKILNELKFHITSFLCFANRAGFVNEYALNYATINTV